METACKGCGIDNELRLGFCFECAEKGEEEAAKRTVIHHLLVGVPKLVQPLRWWSMKIDFRWAWERLTRTGDYAEGGTFDWEGYHWRKDVSS